ncbi:MULTISPECIES: MATE family efflux transporter [Methylophaga]|uniref:Na+-driven multidrug efflux pump n=1 Tax=Methylophaga aminisulfidivorans MP TaxID=1026882 RepID=F5T013_9GAMM|nr:MULTISPECIES: MATE family efflux transporter [Methylophaga]EGL54849.1 Na+-driven multidrug efflux pump [Methylophaga aminisulfidivorans MP]WVI84452.1 MATE family efflux transporter [Methylophaga thalassica]
MAFLFSGTALKKALSHQHIWAIAGPMILANLSTPILGLVDTAVMGHLNSPIYLGAVALGSMVFTFLFWGFGFLRMVTTGLTSQVNGHGSQQETESVLIQSALLASGIALLLLLLQWPIAKIAFSLIDGSAEVLLQAQQYFFVRIWSAPATLLNYAIMGWLIGISASRSALAMAVVINITNIVLDLLFVNVLEMKADGVALATVIAELSGLIFALFLLTRKGFQWQSIDIRQAIKRFIKERHQLALHGNFMLRTLCLIFSFAFFTNQGAQHGDVVLAANMVLLNFITFMAYVLDGFANATEVMTGKAVGRKDKDMLKASLLMNGQWALAVAALFSLVYGLFHQQIVSMLTDIPAVVTLAEQYSTWVIIAPLLAVWSYLFDGLFVGATLGKEMRNAMLFSVFVCFLPSWYFFQDYGNHGLWAALMVLFIARAISQAAYLPGIFQRIALKK